MDRNRLLDTTPDLRLRLAGRATSWKIGYVGAEAFLGFLDDASVPHYLFFFHSVMSRFVSFACPSIDRSRQACASAVHRQLSQGHIHINSLHRRHTRAKPHRIPVRFENNLQLRNHREQVGEIEIAQVRDSENLALHRALSVRNDRSETVAEFL